MNAIVYALIFVLAINLLLWSSSQAIEGMNPDMKIYNRTGTLEQYSQPQNPYTAMPKSGGAVQDSSGNLFIDTFGSIMNWIGQITGFSTIIETAKAPYSFLLLFGLDPALAGVLAAFWYLTTILLIILVVTGRS